MHFIIADTFTKSLEKLNQQSNSLIKQAARDFPTNPAMPGLKCHQRLRAASKPFCSLRVTDELCVKGHPAPGIPQKNSPAGKADLLSGRKTPAHGNGHSGRMGQSEQPVTAGGLRSVIWGHPLRFPFATRDFFPPGSSRPTRAAGRAAACGRAANAWRRRSRDHRREKPSRFC